MMTEIGWAPQKGPQTALVQCPIEDVFYGGARGGGKTDGMLGDWLLYQHRYGGHARGIIFRRTYPELEEIEARAHFLYTMAGADWKSQKRTFIFPNGATLRLRHLDKDKHAAKYQGHSYSWMGTDELTHFPSPDPIDLLWATLRSPYGLPIRRVLTGNPGGPGHNWVKARYIDPAPPYTPFVTEQELPDGMVAAISRVFIPATLDDNPALTKNDPGYWQRVVMAASGKEWLLKAWRYGLWDIVAGGFFDDLWNRSVHILRPFPIPFTWRIDRSFDWGSSKPFSVGWWAESDGCEVGIPNPRKNESGQPDYFTRTFPRGTLFRIHEWYGWDGETPNKGTYLQDTEIAKGIVWREKTWKIRDRVRPGPADSAIFDADPGRQSIADVMKKHGAKFYPADKKPGSRKQGWEAMRRRLLAALEDPMESPGLFVFDTCRQFIRTVPVLQRDERDPDDVDTESEDHIADEARYRVMAPKRGVSRERMKV